MVDLGIRWVFEWIYFVKVHYFICSTTEKSGRTIEKWIGIEMMYLFEYQDIAGKGHFLCSNPSEVTD
jgi:hypothetical protein